jgi:hypothetical protein
MRKTQLLRDRLAPSSIGAAQAEVDLYFLARSSFHAPNPSRLRRFNLADKTLYRLIGITEVVLLDQILVDTSGTQANLELSANHLSQAFAPTPAPSPNAGDRNGWFSIRFLLRAGDRNGRFCQPQIPAYRFAIDPQLARNSSLRPSTIGQAVNRCLQAHFEDIRHAPLNLFLPGPMELLSFPESGWF